MERGKEFSCANALDTVALPASGARCRFTAPDLRVPSRFRGDSTARRLACRVLVCGVAVCGCSTTGRDLELPPEVTTVSVSSGTKLSGRHPAELTVLSGRTWTFWLSAGDASRFWTLKAVLSEEQAVAEKVTLLVAGSAPTTEQALIRDAATGWATSGMVTIERSKGRASGTAVVQPDTLSATFEGKFGVSCWVPRSALGEAGASSSGGDVEPDVEDTALSTPGCSAYRALLQ